MATPFINGGFPRGHNRPKRLLEFFEPQIERRNRHNPIWKVRNIKFDRPNLELGMPHQQFINGGRRDAERHYEACFAKIAPWRFRGVIRACRAGKQTGTAGDAGVGINEHPAILEADGIRWADYQAGLAVAFCNAMMNTRTPNPDEG